MFKQSLKKVRFKFRLLLLRLKRKVYLKFPVWNLSLRWKIQKDGGRINFLRKKFGLNPRKIRKASQANLYIYKVCIYAKWNGGWCNLPCLFCEKFRSIKVKVPKREAKNR